VILRLPRPVTEVLGRPAAEPSHVSWTCVLGVKPLPVTMTEVPAAPVDGESEIEGAVVAANVDDNGTRSAAAATTIATIADKSRQRERRRGFGGVVTSETHRVPSQKDNVLLHSAARLTQ
jgi:hypothetical protein